MKITTARLKEIIKEEISEATGGLSRDQSGPVTRETALTDRTLSGVKGLIKQMEAWKRMTDRPWFDRLIMKLKSYHDDLDRELPVRPHGKGIPIDSTKYIEAPVQQELDEMRAAIDAARRVFDAVMKPYSTEMKEPRDFPRGIDKLVKAIDDAWPGGRYRYNTPGATHRDNRLQYDPEQDVSRNLEIQEIIAEELEAVLAEKGRTAKGNITQKTREKYATVGKDKYPIFDKKSAEAAIDLRGHTSKANQKKIINKAAKYAPKAAKKARKAEKKEKSKKK